MNEYRTILEISDTSLTLENVYNVRCGELAEVVLQNGEFRPGTVVEVGEHTAVVRLFGGTSGISTSRSKVRFLGHQPELAVSSDILGRIFNGLGKPADGGPEILAEKRPLIADLKVNPASRMRPRGFIQTGISAIDGLYPIVCGQKMAIFSGTGLPHAQLCAQIARQSSLFSDKSVSFAVVFAALGTTFEECEYFIQEFNRTGIMGRTVMFRSLSDDPVYERLTAARMAMTAAEYLAFEKDMQVIVIMTDIGRYADALCDVFAGYPTLPGGYPAVLSSDLGSLFERAGLRTGKAGSITLLPVLASGGDFLSDTVTRLTDGKLVLSGEFYSAGLNPPVDVLASSTRFREAYGSDTPVEDGSLTTRLLNAYRIGGTAKKMLAMWGENALTPDEITYAGFAADFESKYIAQGYQENRPLEDTLSAGERLLGSIKAEDQNAAEPGAEAGPAENADKTVSRP